jgi:hypothetical protein
MFVKTDVAKFENSWMGKPHIVSRGAQKNFSDFAAYVAKKWGEDGRHFNNDGYFRNVVARAILFRSVEKLVSAARWYQTGLPRAQIVTYTISKLARLADEHEEGASLDFKAIWDAQSLPPALETFLQKLAQEVCGVITEPPVQGMHVGEWSKKEACWQRVKDLNVSIPIALQDVFVGRDEVRADTRDNALQGRLDNQIDALTTVVTLGAVYWSRLASWAAEYSPIFGMEADLVRNASRPGWLPTDRQAAVLMRVRERLEHEGFRADS